MANYKDIYDDDETLNVAIPLFQLTYSVNAHGEKALNVICEPIENCYLDDTSLPRGLAVCVFLEYILRQITENPSLFMGVNHQEIGLDERGIERRKDE